MPLAFEGHRLAADDDGEYGGSVCASSVSLSDRILRTDGDTAAAGGGAGVVAGASSAGGVVAIVVAGGVSLPPLVVSWLWALGWVSGPGFSGPEPMWPSLPRPADMARRSAGLATSTWVDWSSRGAPASDQGFAVQRAKELTGWGRFFLDLMSR